MTLQQQLLTDVHWSLKIIEGCVCPITIICIKARQKRETDRLLLTMTEGQAVHGDSEVILGWRGDTTRGWPSLISGTGGK